MIGIKNEYSTNSYILFESWKYFHFILPETGKFWKEFRQFAHIIEYYYLCTVKSKLMFHSLNFTIMNEFGKGFMKALGIAAGTAVVVTVITVASGGTLTAAGGAIISKLAGAAAAGAAIH